MQVAQPRQAARAGEVQVVRVVQQRGQEVLELVLVPVRGLDLVQELVQELEAAARGREVEAPEAMAQEVAGQAQEVAGQAAVEQGRGEVEREPAAVVWAQAVAGVGQVAEERVLEGVGQGRESVRVQGRGKVRAREQAQAGGSVLARGLARAQAWRQKSALRARGSVCPAPRWPLARGQL